MIQYIYASDFADELKSEDFEAILKSAVTKNRGLGITGMMVVINQHIFQVIEGPEHNVLSLMESIKADRRHQNIRVIGVNSIVTRDYSDWSMGFTSSWQGKQLDDIKSVLLQFAQNNTFSQQHADSLRMLMRSLRPVLL
ncbi:BLUF domain-containing protein [Aliiglaciecola sp. LCG003]|uniref:BLUF domain-containing protein n=1 Tax=Aliiglaciecola sp. LCG003 TaxID=3053655 RepID=UPI00257346B8|nr:BLUF domain-containing protein [Aliiglaciecola sp. LCG003]WJG10971.1 BLUF domain-containing protein [Aliiglaciecola sp. LCG003]